MADETTKKIPRSYSRYTREAVRLLGGLIRARRIERRLSVEDLATRSGVSRDMMRRIEQGDPRCAIGLAFAAAAILGVALFDSDRDHIAGNLPEQEKQLRLIPTAVHKPRTDTKEDI